MGIIIENLTEKDIRKFKREMEGYEKSKKVFLILGFIFLGLTLLFLFLGIVFIVLAVVSGSQAAQSEDAWAGYEFAALFVSLAITTLSFGSTFCVVTIVMFVLRGVLFQKKIENRLTAIEEYELYQKQLQEHPELIVKPEPQEESKEEEPAITEIV